VLLAPFSLILPIFERRITRVSGDAVTTISSST